MNFLFLSLVAFFQFNLFSQTTSNTYLDTEELTVKNTAFSYNPSTNNGSSLKFFDMDLYSNLDFGSVRVLVNAGSKLEIFSRPQGKGLTNSNMNLGFGSVLVDENNMMLGVIGQIGVDIVRNDPNGLSNYKNSNLPFSAGGKFVALFVKDNTAKVALTAAFRKIFGHNITIFEMFGSYCYEKFSLEGEVCVNGGDQGTIEYDSTSIVRVSGLYQIKPRISAGPYYQHISSSDLSHTGHAGITLRLGLYKR